MRLPSVVLSLITSLIVGPAAGADEPRLHRDLAEKFGGLVERFTPLTRENAEMAEEVRERVREYAERAPSLEIETLISKVNPRADTLDARARGLADDLLTRLRRARSLPADQVDARMLEASEMIDDLAQVFALIASNAGSRNALYQQGLGRAAVGVGAVFGAGVLLNHFGGFNGAEAVGDALLITSVPSFGLVMFNQKIPYARDVLTWLGGREPGDDVLVVRAFGRFWSYLEQKVIADPAFGDFTTFDGPTFFPPKLMQTILALGASPEMVCETWLLRTPTLSPAAPHD